MSGGGPWSNQALVTFQTVLANSINAVQPGSPGTTESWHQATLINGYTGSGSGVNGLWYRLLPWGTSGMTEIIADISNGGQSTTDACFVLPTGYVPATAQNHGFFYTATTSFVTVDTSGNVIPTAAFSTQLFFHIFVPLETL